MLVWPHVEENWECGLAAVEAVYRDLIAAVSPRQRVLLLAQDARLADHIREFLAAEGIGPAELLVIPNDDIWVRDYGPMQLLTPRGLVWLDWEFNGWGGKFSCTRDNEVTQALLRQYRPAASACLKTNLVAEGGNFDSDGAGSALVNLDCLHSTSRNAPALGKLLAAQLRQCGVERIIGITDTQLEGDDTDGHIDTLARFCSPSVIAFATCARSDRQQWRRLAPMREQLRRQRTRADAPYELVPLPLPAPLFNQAGDRLAASYLNFVIVNDAVLMPGFADPNDELARQTLADGFPERTVITVPANPLALQSGSLHCASLNLFDPATGDP